MEVDDDDIRGAQASSSICCFEQAFSLGQLPNAFERCEYIAARLPKRQVENRRLTYDDPSLVEKPEDSRCFIFRGGFGEQHPGFRGALKFPLPLSLRRSWLFRVPSNGGHANVCVRRHWGGVRSPVWLRDSIDEMAKAREYAMATGGAVPMTALERANAAVRNGGINAARKLGDGLVAGPGAIRNAPASFQNLQKEAAQSLATGRYLLEAAKSQDGRATLRAVAADGIKRRHELNTETARNSALAKSAKVLHGNVSAKVSEKAAAFAQNPVTETWKTTKTVGKVAGIGMLGVVTGGYGLALPAAHIVRKEIGKKRERDTAAQTLMIQNYRDAQKVEAHNESIAKEAQIRSAANAMDAARGSGAAGRGTGTDSTTATQEN